MRFAIIENGIVVNVAVSSPEFAASKGWIACGDASPGDLYDEQTGEFSKPEIEE